MTNDQKNVLSNALAVIEKEVELQPHTFEEVIRAAKDIKSAFPEIFSDNEIFCKVGSLIRKFGNPNIYACFIQSGDLTFVNITNGVVLGGNNTALGKIREQNLLNEGFVTRGEFKRLVSLTNKSIDDLYPIEIVEEKKADEVKKMR